MHGSGMLPLGRWVCLLFLSLLGVEVAYAASPVDSLLSTPDTVAVVSTPSEAPLQELPMPQVETKRNWLAIDANFVPNSTIAASLGIVPGLGQIYNRKYWKVPLVLGVAAGCAYAISWNARTYNEYHSAYVDFKSEKPLERESWKAFVPQGSNPADYVGNSNIEARLKRGTELYRRNRDLSIIVSCLVYVLSIIDAYVDAELFLFDISPNLGVSLLPAPTSTQWGAIPATPPLSAVSFSYNITL